MADFDTRGEPQRAETQWGRASNELTAWAWGETEGRPATTSRRPDCRVPDTEGGPVSAERTEQRVDTQGGEGGLPIPEGVG
jgi:hypothetical protein